MSGEKKRTLSSTAYNRYMEDHVIDLCGKHDLSLQASSKNLTSRVLGAQLSEKAARFKNNVFDGGFDALDDAAKKAKIKKMNDHVENYTALRKKILELQLQADLKEIEDDQNETLVFLESSKIMLGLSFESLHSMNAFGLNLSSESPLISEDEGEGFDEGATLAGEETFDADKNTSVHDEAVNEQVRFILPTITLFQTLIKIQTFQVKNSKKRKTKDKAGNPRSKKFRRGQGTA